jgi:hypothetical protein
MANRRPEYEKVALAATLPLDAIQRNTTSAYRI